MPHRTKTFNDWLYSEKFADPNHNRHHWMQEFSDMNQQDIRDYWLLMAWWAGYHAAKAEDEHAKKVPQ